MARVEHGTWSSAGEAAWVARGRGKETLVPGGAMLDPSLFRGRNAVAVTLTAAASSGATTLAVAALSAPIPAGTLLYFGETGEIARTSGAVAAGATSVPVDATPSAIESGDTALYSNTGPKQVASGTVVGVTQAEWDAGAAWGPASASDDYVRIVAFTIDDLEINAEFVMLKPGTEVKVNYLPGWDALASGVKGKVRTTYVPVKGVN